MTKQIFAIAAIAIAGSGILYSCKKDANTAPANTQQAQVKKAGITHTEPYTEKFRKYSKKKKDCINEDGNCHPKDIIITGIELSNFDNALTQGGPGVSHLFSNNETAIKYVPEWNADWFVDIKAATLSGEYTFVKGGETVYLLGKVGTVNTDNFDYAISYKIQ